MANLKIVDNYKLPPWVDMGSFSEPDTYIYRPTVAFSGEQNGKAIKPSYVGINPFNADSSFSVGGFSVFMYPKENEDALGRLFTSLEYGSDHGVKEYDFTSMSSEGDTIVFEVVPRIDVDPEEVNPNKITVRELTEQEKKYVGKVQENELDFFTDQRERLS